MGIPIQIKAKEMEKSILCFKGSQIGIPNYGVFLTMRIVFILANSAGPD